MTGVRNWPRVERAGQADAGLAADLLEVFVETQGRDVARRDRGVIGACAVTGWSQYAADLA
jgi:hypothetical protein